MAKVRITGVTNIDGLIVVLIIISAVMLTHAARYENVLSGVKGVEPAELGEG